ncbi:MAG: hypothetical protein RLZZ370_1729 [Bacteroidota bacterium]
MNREPVFLKICSALNGIVCVLLAARHLNRTWLFPAPESWWFLCAAALGFVYAFDLVMDLRRMKNPRSLLSGAAILLPALLAVGFALPFFSLRNPGEYLNKLLLPIALTSIYLTGIVWKRWRLLNPFREVLAALVFASTLIVAASGDAVQTCALAFLFGFGCLANLLLGSWYDFEQDQHYGMTGLLHSSWFPGSSTDHMRSLFVIMLLVPPACIKLASGYWTSWALPESALWVYVAMVAGLWMIRETPLTFRRFGIHRFVADWLLLLWLLV